MSTLPLNMKAYRSISEFTKDLARVFGANNRPLALYCRFIENLDVSHEDLVRGIVDGFKEFIDSNREAIETQDISKLNENRISVLKSTTIHLTPKALFSEADEEVRFTMWKYFLVIYGHLYPESPAKSILKNMKSAAVVSASTAAAVAVTPALDPKFIGSMISQIIPHLDPNETDPIAMFRKLTESGVLTNLAGSLYSEVQKGNIDANSLASMSASIFSNLDSVLPEEKKN